MDIEFHYTNCYILALLAKQQYSKHAKIIANSSQFTDDNTQVINLSLTKSPSNKAGGVNDVKFQRCLKQPFPQGVQQTSNCHIKNSYSSFPTAGIFALNNMPISPLACFHFIPQKPYNQVTQAGSEIATNIFKKALLHNNPYLTGIALHAYCDTWAHQNFCATVSSANSPYLLNIGHIHYGTSPDKIAHKWQDDRLPGKPLIQNNHRFLKAALSALRLMSSAQEYPQKAKWFYKNIYNIWQTEECGKTRMHKYAYNVQQYFDVEIANYCATKWKNKAMRWNYVARRYESKENFYQSHWYRFQESAKLYYKITLEEFLDVEKSLYENSNRSRKSRIKRR